MAEIYVDLKILVWVKNFAIFWYVLVYSLYVMTEVIQTVEGTSYGWQYYGSWSADMLWIASFYVGLESHIDERAT